MNALRGKIQIIKDFIYSITASLLVVGIVQLLVYPILAKIFNGNEYGELLTVMGIVNTISSAFGNTLNNTRLIQNAKYIDKNLKGDFNLILVIANITSFIITVFIGLVFFDYNTINVVLTAILTVLIIIKSYYSVAYRIKINYILNLLSCIVSCIGYVIGLIAAYGTQLWPLAFIIAEIFNIVFIIFTSDLHKEPYKITEIFKETSVKYILLIITGLLGNLLVYLDRLIIFPILGGESVSIYTIASVFGKSLGLLLTPIAAVLLSYYSQKSFIMTRKMFWMIDICVFMASIVFLAFSYFVSPWFTGILYPDFIDEAKKYIFLANLAAIIGAAGNIIQPSVLRFADIYWQVVKELIYGMIYIGFGFILLRKYGLYGFCWAAIIANSIKLVLLCIIGTVYIGQKSVDANNNCA